MRTGISVALIIVALARPAAAQGILDKFSYEGLAFSGVGVAFGAVTSNRLTDEIIGAVRVDYGFIAPRVRVLLGGSYFKGDFDAEEISEFETKLRGLVRDPTRDFTINVGTVSWSDLALDFDLQYLLQASSRVRTFAGVGVASHLRNGSGRAIEGTFVEDALDNIEAGLNFSLATEVTLVRHLDFTVELRGGITSGLRTGSILSGLMYRVH
ncbi:MAG: hypothetical protein ACE5HT_07990 [Gemmatimonadales bacterium]